MLQASAMDELPQLRVQAHNAVDREDAVHGGARRDTGTPEPARRRMALARQTTTGLRCCLLGCVIAGMLLAAGLLCCCCWLAVLPVCY